MRPDYFSIWQHTIFDKLPKPPPACIQPGSGGVIID